MAEHADDAGTVAASLDGWLATLTFLDRTEEEVTALLVDSVARWGAQQGWRVYRRAASVLPLPPPYQHQHSWLDVACARPGRPPVAVEIDRTGRRRSVDKLLAEAGAGRVAIWVRWSDRAIEPPPPPIGVVTFRVTARSGAGRGRLYSRLPATDRPAPTHTAAAVGPGEQAGLFGTADDRDPAGPDGR